MKINEREIKLLLFLIILSVILLPYFFIMKPVIEVNEVISSEIAVLEIEKARLEAERAKVPFYQEEITNYTKLISEILARYPRNIPQEAAILFIDRTEKLIAMTLESVSFGTVVYGLITVEEEEEETEERKTLAARGAEQTNAAVAEIEGTAIEENAPMTMVGDKLRSISLDMNFSYLVDYNGFKEFLAYIRGYQDRAVITSLTASYNMETQQVGGAFSMSTYAIDGPGRQPVHVSEPVFDLGTSNIFMQAEGIYEGVRDNFTPDYFMMLSRIDGAVIGRSYDNSEASYLKSDNNAKHNVNITFTGNGGRYTAEYALDEDVYLSEFEFFRDGSINFAIYSSAREGSRDNFAADINVINETDIDVNVLIYGDDLDNPRVFINFVRGQVDVLHY